MPFNAKVLRVMIVSPSDVAKERELITDVIQEWMDAKSDDKRIVTMPLKWETHSAPELNKRPQEIINTEVVDLCDFAIGVFWSRIGTPTGLYQSGSIEEIDRIGKANKLVLCYFSKIGKPVEEIDIEQLNKLNEFKKNTYKNGLVYSYRDIVDFKENLRKHLDIKLKTIISNLETNSHDEFSLKPKLTVELNKSSDEEFENLRPTITIFENTKFLDSLPEGPTEVGKSEVVTYYKDVGYGTGRITHEEHINQNSEFYLSVLNYYKLKDSFYPISLNIENEGNIPIKDTYVEISLVKQPSVRIRRYDLKKSGSKSYGAIVSIPGRRRSKFEKYENIDLNDSGFSSNRVIVHKIELREDDNNYHISFPTDNIQPKRSITLENIFFLSKDNNGSVELIIRVFADCLEEPKLFSTTMEFNIQSIKRDAEQFLIEKDLYRKTE